MLDISLKVGQWRIFFYWRAPLARFLHRLGREQTLMTASLYVRLYSQQYTSASADDAEILTGISMQVAVSNEMKLRLPVAGKI